MLFIYKDDKTVLPARLHQLNNLCSVLYDMMAEYFIDKNFKELISLETNVSFVGKTHLTELKNNEISILEWLELNNLDDVLSYTLVRHVGLSIIADFLSFIFESLQCAKKGSMTVAYSLLRKPFSDELLLLEQIIFDSKDFIQRFYHNGDPISYDPSHSSIDKLEIIKNAISKIKNRLTYFDADLIYQLRYDKSCPSGINGISNHALHIVTRDKNYKTLNQNLNLIFSSQEETNSQWEHYYYFIPNLLIYASAIFDKFVFDLMPVSNLTNRIHLKTLRRFIAFIVFSEATNEAGNHNKMYELLIKSIKLPCKHCQLTNTFSKDDFILFLNAELLLCSKCTRNLMDDNECINQITKFIQSI